jgi:hypothetical protein
MAEVIPLTSALLSRLRKSVKYDNVRLVKPETCEECGNGFWQIYAAKDGCAIKCGYCGTVYYEHEPEGAARIS